MAATFGWLQRTVTGLFLAATVAGCVSNGGLSTSAGNRQVPVSEAFMVPPPGGPGIIAVVEQRYTNGIAQDIILENNSGAPGQNVLYLRAWGPMGRDAGVGTLRPDRPTVTDIGRELRGRFPGIGMDISGLYAQNRYGPIGYATGRSASGANCIYVWQRLEGDQTLFSSRRGAITWRLRLCDPDTSLRDLLLSAYGFTIVGGFLSQHWNPFGDPPDPDPRIGKPGVAILPQQTVDPTVVAPDNFGSAPAAASAPARPVRRRPATPQPEPVPTVLNEPLPGAAVVPRPAATDLSEPVVERSNLPTTAPRLDSGAGGVAVPRPAGDTPVPVVPPPPGTTGPQSSSLRSPQVRVVDTN